MASDTPSVTVDEVSDDEFLALARRSAHPVPIEQAPVWDAFDAVVPGRGHWRRLALRVGGPGADAAVAVVSLSRYEGRGFSYLWAKHGPVWVADQTPALERAARHALAAYVSREEPKIVFIRMSARHAAPDLRELLQTVTYDRTVLVDLTQGDDARLAALSKSTRKKLRAVLADASMTVAEETGISRADFEELYAIHRETAARGEFGIFGADVYHSMLGALAPHARLFVVRRSDAGTYEQPRIPGRAIAWLISTEFDGGGINYYSAANAEARHANAPLLLRWHAMATFAAAGVREYDFMGVDSPRVPTLKGVGEFKRQFGPEVEVDGAWDVVLRPWRYRMLRAALAAKRFARR